MHYVYLLKKDASAEAAFSELLAHPQIVCVPIRAVPVHILVRRRVLVPCIFRVFYKKTKLGVSKLCVSSVKNLRRYAAFD